MLIGIPKEIKNHEYRVGLTPASARELVARGHRVLIQSNAGAAYLEKPKGGAGVLLGGVPGVAPGRVAVLGGGVVGYNAALIAVGMGADVAVIDRSNERLRWLDERFGNRVQTLFATRSNIEAATRAADLIVGAVLVPGAAAPRLLSRDDLRHLRSGTVLVDVAIDQGGCFETSRPTTHAEPVFEVGGIVHYCVANMPGAVPRTSTFALNNATLPFVEAIADQGWEAAMRNDVHMRNGLNVHRGQMVNKAAASALGLNWLSFEQAIA